MDINYDEFAARAERGELRVKAGTERHGPDAADAARRALLEAAGATTVEELTHMAVGRPSVGEKAGASPVVRARVSQALKARVLAQAARENRKESELVRDALAAYIENHAVAS